LRTRNGKIGKYEDYKKQVWDMLEVNTLGHEEHLKFIQLAIGRLFGYTDKTALRLHAKASKKRITELRALKNGSPNLHL